MTEGGRSIRTGSLAAGLLAALGCALFALSSAGQGVEGASEDLRFRLRGPRASSAKVAVVALDDEAIRRWEDTPQVALGDQYALLIRRALAAGARVVALDVIPVFDTDSYLHAVGAGPDLRPNAHLAEAVLDGDGRVLLGGASSIALNELPDSIALAALEQGVGLLDLPPLRGGGVQRDALLYQEDEQAAEATTRYCPSIAALLSLRAAGVGEWPPARDRMDRLVAAGAAFSTPDDGNRAFGVNFRSVGPAGVTASTPVVPAVRLAEGALTPSDRDALRGAVVLIGFTYSGTQDLHPAPGGGRPVPGVFLHAEAVATLLDGAALRRLPDAAGPLLALCGGAALAAALARAPLRSGRRTAAALVLGAVAYGGAGQAAFSRANVVLPVAAPLLTLAAVPLAHFAARSLEEHRRWNDLRATFARYVSPAVAEYLLASEENRRPGGRRGTATCMFLDLRDSVRFAAEYPADVVMRDLNRMFEEIVPAIQSRGGSILKYTGDGLLAVFGAPVPAPEGDGGAQAAVDAALDIVERVAALDARRRAEDPGAFPFVVGAGIQTGPFVFGNLGSADRPEFTAIGDTVNVAARLEGLTKPEALDAPVVVGETTYQALTRRPPAGEPVTRDIRGHGPLMIRGLRPAVEWRQSP
jgi:adenylate cyclase